ncbi:MAG: hypothetical protein ACREMN_12860 [Gemmatimonadales bacterium]
MNRLWLRVTLVLLLFVLAASTADAQRRRRRPAAIGGSTLRFGPHIGYNFDVDELALGAQLSLPLLRDIDLYPTFDYYFLDIGSLWALNFDLKYRPPSRFGTWYLGGGLNYLRRSAGGTSAGDTNLNLLTGLEGRRGRTRPYVEARFILGDDNMFQLVGGFSWR